MKQNSSTNLKRAGIGLAVIAVVAIMGVAFQIGASAGARDEALSVDIESPVVFQEQPAAQTTVPPTTTTTAPPATTTTTIPPATTTTRLKPELVENTVSIMGALSRLFESVDPIRDTANDAMDRQDSSTLSAAAEGLANLAPSFRDLASEATDPLAREAVYAYEAAIMRTSHGYVSMAYGIEVGNIDEINKAGDYFVEAGDYFREARTLLDRAQDQMWNWQQS